MATTPSHRTLPFASLPALTAILFSASARGEPMIPHKVRLEVVHGPGAEACPGEAVVRHAILSNLKEDPFSPDAKASLRVDLHRVGPEFAASYELRDDDGKLILEQKLAQHRKCAVAVADVGFSVSVHIPPLLTAPTPAPAAEPPSPPPSPPPPPPPPSLPPPSLPPPSPPPEGKPARPLVGRADAGVLVGFGATPATALGFSAHGGGSWWFLSLSLGGRLEFSLAEGPDAVRVSASRLLGEVVPCLHLGRGFGCGVVQVGELIAKVQMPDYVSILYTPSVSAGGRLGFQIPLPRLLPPGLDLYGSLDLAGAALRSNIWVGDPPRQFEWRAPPFTMALGLGVVYSP